MVLAACFARGETLRMSFSDTEISKVIDYYSRSTGQKFIVDGSVKGKISIHNPTSVSRDEAFNQLSTALSISGFAISKQGDTMVVRPSRHVQRDLIEVGTTVPPIKPERLYTWVVNLKHVPVEKVMREMRTLASRDGEIVMYSDSNQLYITDWATNLNRISEIIKHLDRPVEPEVAKVVARHKKNSRKRDVDGQSMKLELKKEKKKRKKKKD